MNCRTLKCIISLPLAAWLGFFAGAHSSGAASAFLFIEGIPGESVQEHYAGWIEVHDFEQRFGRDKADHDDLAGLDSLRIHKSLDKSTPLLFDALTRGAVYPRATLAFVLPRADEARFYQVELGNVSVAGVEVGGPASERPGEELVVVFEFIEWTYTEFDLRGNPLADHSAYWDLVKGEGGSEVVRRGFSVTATRPMAGQMRLRWQAVSGGRYHILQSASVTGPYQLREIITADDDTGEITLPVLDPSQFFLVREEQ
jgi:type VI secretion system Hcp family effector